MRANGISARRPRRFRNTTDSNHNFAVAENVLDRRFTVERPNEAWVGDITYVPTLEGWLFLAVILDLFSRKVIGWAMADHLRAELAIDALRMAITSRAPTDSLIHHTDRGVQYACTDYQAVLEANGFVCSMSRKGNCWDNAVAESFFGTLETELIDRSQWKTRGEATHAIFEFIEVFYNRRRRHSHLSYDSPAEFEMKFDARQVALAA
jgi:putative transposase